MIMIILVVTVPNAIAVAGGLTIVCNHFSMVLIDIIQLSATGVGLSGTTGKVAVTLSSSRR